MAWPDRGLPVSPKPRQSKPPLVLIFRVRVRFRVRVWVRVYV